MSIFMIRRRKNIHDLRLKMTLLKRLIISLSQLCFHFFESSLIVSVYVFHWRLPPSSLSPSPSLRDRLTLPSLQHWFIPSPSLQSIHYQCKVVDYFCGARGEKMMEWNWDSCAFNESWRRQWEKRLPPLPLSRSNHWNGSQLSLSYKWKFPRRRGMTFKEWDHWNPWTIESIQREENGQEKEREKE